MARPRRTIVPLDAEATDTRTETQASPLVAVPSDPFPTQPQRTPARQRLADAIAEVKALEAEIADAGAIVSEMDANKWKTASALADAEAELERARPRPFGSTLQPREPWTFSSQEEAESYHAKLNEPPLLIEDAKAAVARATDARDSALTALQFHRQRLDKATDRLSWKRSSIDDALRFAVHYDPAMAALAAETKRLVTAAAAACRAFNDAVGPTLMQSDHQFYDATKPTDFRTDPEGWRVVHQWRLALEDLRRDPDAPLPMPPAA